MARNAPQPRPSRAAPRAGERGVRVVLYVSPEQHAEIHRRAHSVGRSIGGYIWPLVDRDVLDDEGRPAWAAEEDRQAEELPLAI